MERQVQRSRFQIAARLHGGRVWLSCVRDTYRAYLCVLDTYQAYSFKQGFNIACKCLFLHVRVKQVAFTISACIHTRGKTSTSATSTFLPYPTQWLVYTLAVRLPYPPPQLWFWGETRAQCADTGDHSLLFDSCTLCIRQTLLCFLRFLTVMKGIMKSFIVFWR